jgi:SAM-dependent methyltransferase
VLVGRDRLHDLPGKFRVVKCCTCGLTRTDPRPTQETIGFYYPEDYGPYQGTRVDPGEGTKVRRPLWRRFVARLIERTVEFNYDHLPPLRPGRMLEIGCASGAFLHRMAEKVGRSRDRALRKAANAARSLGYRVYTGALETAPDPEEPYDLVVGWMVLEHLHDPVLALQKLRSWTRPGAG